MGADSSDSAEGSPAEAGFVGVVLVCLFFALYRGYYTPEVVVSGRPFGGRTTAVFCTHVHRHLPALTASLPSSEGREQRYPMHSWTEINAQRPKLVVGWIWQKVPYKSYCCVLCA